ncbi:hypothetical protein N7548_00135 [Acholeplasma manati]|uniref:Uncharacterized protein n=1 Tax=Paracholeplasma manati TaxID=591373 RepID=A0ABT2Y3C1_9MOLU|nr:hypothetical protein [Paracholeplasma manati]MCV2231233.1 hypothetical protein [Paracholeplasma manati]
MQETLFVDPIKVPLDIKTSQTLKEDADFFHIGSVHQFSKLVIKKSYKYFLSRLADKDKKLKKELKKIIFDERVLDEVLKVSKKVYLSFEDTPEIKHKKESITLRINQDEILEFSSIFRIFKSAGLEDVNGFTAFLRILLYQYTRLSRIERERMLFSSQYDTIKNAIDKKAILHLQLRDQGLLSIHPYKIIRFGDECHFLIGDGHLTMDTLSIRLSRIVQLSLDDSQLFESMSSNTTDLVHQFESSSFQYSSLGSQLDSNQILETLLLLQSFTAI